MTTPHPDLEEVARQSAAVGKDTPTLMKMATYAAVATALILASIKIGAWWMTDSVAMLSSFIDSLLDGIASLVNLFAVRQALQPADAEHRFGHGKAEPLAGLMQAAFVSGSAVLLVIEAITRFIEPVVIRQSQLGIGVMGVSIVLTLVLITFQKYVIRKTNSVAISADSLHYAGDVLINAAVILALVLTMVFGWTWIDPLFGLGIAVFLISNAYRIGRESLDLLMDREFEPAEREEILAIARSHPRVYDAHDLRTRSSGLQRFIQFHLEMDRNLPLSKAHAIADQVEHRIRKAFPNAEVIIHQDPAGIREAHHDEVAYQDREHGIPREPAPKVIIDEPVPRPE